MSSTRNPGRVAGFLYLLLVVFAPFRLIYIPSTLFVRGNATTTANNIAAHELLFRLGIVTDLLCGLRRSRLIQLCPVWAHVIIVDVM